jgi:hypothetical protein
MGDWMGKYTGNGSDGPMIRGIEVRWGLREDEDRVAELLELNGMPRPLAFEERFIVAEEKSEMLAALSYKTASKQLRLGFLIADPWAGERSLARALYAGAVALAREAGIGEVHARSSPHGDYPYEIGYRPWRGGWRTNTALLSEVRGELPAGGWRRIFALLDAVSVPFFRTFRA